MERHHIFKLGWTLITCMLFCTQTSVHGLDTDDDVDGRRNVPNPDHEYFQYFQGVDGRPGRDYPVYSYIPRTSFSCRGIESGYYADLETDCQVFHICEEGKKISFLCPNGTIFQQSELICEWWNKVNCSDAPNLYEESAEKLQFEVARRKSSRRVHPIDGGLSNHGAVMRMEERTTVRAIKNGKEYRVRQQVRRTRVKNRRIPDNNDIEQHIEESESNNRHLADAQQHQNHEHDNAADINSQIKKDIDKHTGNFINANYDSQDNNRLSKNVEKGTKNYYEFGSKTGSQKSSTFKEYHVEFGSTSSGLESSTSRYIPTNEDSSLYTKAPSNHREDSRRHQNNGQSSGNEELDLISSGVESSTSSYNPTNSNTSPYSKPTSNYQQSSRSHQNKGQSLGDVELGLISSGVESSTSSYNSNNGDAFPYTKTTSNNRQGSIRNHQHDEQSLSLKKTDESLLSDSSLLSTDTSSSRDSFPTTKDNSAFSTTTEPNMQEYTKIFHGLPQNYEDFGNRASESIRESSKTFRGKVRYSVNNNFVDVQRTSADPTPLPLKSVPVTTYSPYSYKPTLKSTAQNDLLFPTHKSESVKSSFLIKVDSYEDSQSPLQLELKSTTSEAPVNQYPNHKSRESAEKIQQDSDEAQVPLESSSFIKNSFNSITDKNTFKTSPNPYPNHKSTYSDLKDVSFLAPPKVASISSINGHLVTTQTINNGKPFFGSRVGTTLLPNQPTTQSKYTYLPTSTRPTVIFGVIRHSSTTELPPYGPPELFNLGTTDKTLSSVQTTSPVTNPTPSQRFNTGNTGSTIQPNVLPDFEASTIKSLDLDVPEEGSFNTGPAEKASVRTRYKELESLSERFNVGSTDKTLPPIEVTTEITNPTPTEIFNLGNTEKTVQAIAVPGFETNTFAPLNISVPEHGSLNLGPNLASVRHGYQNAVSIPDIFNFGNTDKTLPTVETTPSVTNSVPTRPFNLGYTESTIIPNVVPAIGTSTYKPLEIIVPDQGSLNLGQKEPNSISDAYNGSLPVNEPPFVKKNSPLLYANLLPESVTLKGTIQDTVSTTRRPATIASVTPYSPTVPTVTRSSTSVTRTPKSFNQAVPIRFENGQDKISIHLSKSIGGNTQTKPRTSSPPLQKVNAVLRVADDYQFGGSSTTASSHVQPAGFFVTRDFTEDGGSGFSTTLKSVTDRPRPFAKPVDIENQYNTGISLELNGVRTTFPAYQISSARPFAIDGITSPTPFVATRTAPSFNVYENIDNMMDVLQLIANYNGQKASSEEDSRPRLVIPPSVGPQTLHSLAQYFANELQEDGDDDNEVLTPDTKDKLTGLLTAMTVHGYNNLFNVGSTASPTTSTSSVTTKYNAQNGGSGNSVDDDLNDKGTTPDSDDDLLPTTSLPELRQLARNFSLALSSYLHDPDNFKKSLEGLRPTEPPILDSRDNTETSTAEDELLNFSDADAKPSTPAVPSATWGYFLATDADRSVPDDVRNSLNPDLNTADSQSFIPGYNNVKVDERESKSLPPNHWTSSDRATQLWQKALSVNPAVVNEHLETTPFNTQSSEETSEAEPFNPDVLPEHQTRISYDLREIPPMTLNSTQIHGILIDFMNHSDEHSRLYRILKKLNTSQDEFLERMKEIESNPLTKRLVLLLISECGADITRDLGTRQQSGALTDEAPSATRASTSSGHEEKKRSKTNDSLRGLVHPGLSEEDQDTRALQLLNSLYTIASKFGRRR